MANCIRTTRTYARRATYDPNCAFSDFVLDIPPKGVIIYGMLDLGFNSDRHSIRPDAPQAVLNLAITSGHVRAFSLTPLSVTARFRSGRQGGCPTSRAVIIPTSTEGRHATPLSRPLLLVRWQPKNRDKETSEAPIKLGCQHLTDRSQGGRARMPIVIVGGGRRLLNRSPNPSKKAAAIINLHLGE